MAKNVISPLVWNECQCNYTKKIKDSLLNFKLIEFLNDWILA